MADLTINWIDGGDVGFGDWATFNAANSGGPNAARTSIKNDLESAFFLKNPITVNITTLVDSTTHNFPNFFTSADYATTRTAYQALSGPQYPASYLAAFAALPASDPFGDDGIFHTDAIAAAIGLPGAPSSTSASLWFRNTLTDWTDRGMGSGTSGWGAGMHETTEILGRNAYCALGNFGGITHGIGTVDIWSFTAPGVRGMAQPSGAGVAYVSADGNVNFCEGSNLWRGSGDYGDLHDAEGGGTNSCYGWEGTGAVSRSSSMPMFKGDWRTMGILGFGFKTQGFIFAEESQSVSPAMTRRFRYTAGHV